MIFFFFNDTATTEIYTLSLHDALPIWPAGRQRLPGLRRDGRPLRGAEARLHRRHLQGGALGPARDAAAERPGEDDLRHLRSEEHTSELQSRQYLVCRLLLEKKKKQQYK